MADSLRTALLSVANLQMGQMQRPLDFSLPVGKISMMVGPSGSGKSLILKALSDLIVHQADISLLKPIKLQQQQTGAPKWRQKVMYFAAHSAWWADSIAEHFQQRPSAEELNSVGLSIELLDAHPEQCSSGEKQRLALLRGLQYQPQVLLLDEITANLDAEATEQIEALLIDYIQADDSADRAILWVSHDQQQCQRLADDDAIISLADYV